MKIERLTAAFSPQDLKDLERRWGGKGSGEERKSMEREKDADTEDGAARG